MDIPTRIIGSGNRWRWIVLYKCGLETLASVYINIGKVTHLTIGINGPRECLCQPIQCDRLQDVDRSERIINPFQEFLTHPVEISVTSFSGLISNSWNSPCQKSDRA
jgi:hypothetical protein